MYVRKALNAGVLILQEIRFVQQIMVIYKKIEVGLLFLKIVINPKWETSLLLAVL